MHHSAEVLTPLTAARNHPVFILIRSVIHSLMANITRAAVFFLLIGEVDLPTIGGANAAYFIFNVMGSNLRRSPVWLSRGRVLEHVLISPAQRRIHNSCDVRHALHRDPPCLHP